MSVVSTGIFREHSGIFREHRSGNTGIVFRHIKELRDTEVHFHYFRTARLMTLSCGKMRLTTNALDKNRMKTLLFPGILLCDG